MAEIWNKMGRPATVEEAKFNWPDDGPQLSEPDQVISQEFVQFGWGIGLSQDQMDKLTGWQAKTMKVSADAERARAENLTQERMSTIKATWASDFEDNKNAYQGSAQHYMGADFETFKELRLDDGTLVANHPVIANAFAKVGRDRANDDWDINPMNQTRKESAAEELRNLQNKVIEQGLRPGMPDYPAEEFDRLYKQSSSTRKRSPNDTWMANRR